MTFFLCRFFAPHEKSIFSHFSYGLRSYIYDFSVVLGAHFYGIVFHQIKQFFRWKEFFWSILILFSCFKLLLQAWKWRLIRLHSKKGKVYFSRHLLFSIKTSFSTPNVWFDRMWNNVMLCTKPAHLKLKKNLIFVLVLDHHAAFLLFNHDKIFGTDLPHFDFCNICMSSFHRKINSETRLHC